MIFSDKDLSRAALAARVLRRASEAGAFASVENAFAAVAAARGLLGDEFDDVTVSGSLIYRGGELPFWSFQLDGAWDHQLIALFGDG